MTMAWFSSRIPVAAMCVVVLAMASRNALAQTTSDAGTGFGANTVHHSRYTLRRRDHREQQQLQPRGRRMTDAEMAYAFDHLRDLADDHEMSFSMNLGANRFIEDPAKVAAVPHARAKGISAKSKSNDKGKSGKSDKESKSGSKQEKKKEKSGSSKAGSNKLKKSKGRRLRVESGAERARFRSSRIRPDAATAATATATATFTAKGASSSWKSDRRLIGAGCTYEMGWTSSKEGSKDRSKEGSRAGSKSGSKTGGRGKDGGGRVGRDRGRRRIETGVFDCRTSGSFTCCREWGDTGDDELCCRTEAAPIGGNEQSNDGEDVDEDDEDDNKNEKSGGAKRYSEDGEDEDADENKNENSGGAKRYSEDFFHLTDPDGPVPQIRPNLVDEESKSNDFPY